ncbi:MAG: hypothetical protein KatS3mg083_142 [Candidatus Dojkabacteria bacterium]|nr:MAG: hypothetical protein KatS3mg083_142 [Candidatus Dojkabacteria bacterium]
MWTYSKEERTKVMRTLGLDMGIELNIEYPDDIANTYNLMAKLQTQVVRFEEYLLSECDLIPKKI